MHRAARPTVKSRATAAPSTAATWAVIALFVAARVFMLLAQPWASEDAYITFRYAWHLAHGNGLVFNPGEWVMGFTSPLWTLWCALGITLGAAPETWAQWTSLLFGAWALHTAMQQLARHASRTSAVAFGLAYALWPLFSALTASGLEMEFLFAGMVIAGTQVHARGRGAGVALGLLALTRPEGTVAALVLACFADRRARLVGGAIVALGAGLLAWAYGSPLPHSVLAKRTLYGTPGPWVGRHWLDWLLPLPMLTHTAAREGAHLARLGWLWLPAAVLGVPAGFRLRATPVAWIALAGLTVWAGYAALGVAYFWWYSMIPVVTLFWLAALGLSRLPRWATRWPVLAAAALILALSWLDLFPVYLGRAQNEFRTFHPIADALRSRARPSDLVMAEPIGLIGFVTMLPILDESGLVSPETLQRRKLGDGWYTDLVARRQPRWLVIRPAVLATGEAFAGRGRPFRDDAGRLAILRDYHSVWPVAPAQSDALWLMERRP